MQYIIMHCYGDVTEKELLSFLQQEMKQRMLNFLQIVMKIYWQ